MSKIYGMITVAVAALCLSAPAQANVDARVLEVVSALQNASVVQAHYAGLDWRVGDKASHKITNMLLNGSSDSFVREDTGTSFWMVQDMNLGMMGKQKIEVLMNKTTGQIEKMLVNGQEQQAPKPDVEVVEMKEDKITVAAGSFDCIYAKIKNKGDGKITQAWINPKAVPMSGQLKVIAESQFGEIVQELTSFQFAAR